MQHLKKRLLVLLLPWAVWSFIYYWLFKTDVGLLDYIKVTAYNMESSFWFLFTLWVIDILHSVALLVSKMAIIGRKILAYSLLYCTGGGILALVGYKFGLSFLGIQYTLYYMPFFFLGFLVGHYKNMVLLWDDRLRDILWGLSCIVFFLIILKFGYTNIPYTSYHILVRIGLSLTGCYCIIGLVNKIRWEDYPKLRQCFSMAGRFSLEIYVIHVVVLRFLGAGDKCVDTIEGLLLCTANFVLVYLTVVLFVKLFHSNKYTSMLLFGKK